MDNSTGMIESNTNARHGRNETECAMPSYAVEGFLPVYTHTFVFTYFFWILQIRSEREGKPLVRLFVHQTYDCLVPSAYFRQWRRTLTKSLITITASNDLTMNV